MSAPQIPNLNTLRRGDGRRGGRGRESAIATADGSHGSNSVTKDEIVQSTDNDAATSRLSAVDAGYLEDPFAKLLTHDWNVDRRLPLMNRGTYVRTAAIDGLVDRFLGSDQTRPRQIISLGAGSDTRFFRLKERFPDISLIYHEFDFAVNTAAKIKQMQMPSFVECAKSRCDIDLLSDNTSPPTGHAQQETLLLRGDQSLYRLHPLDLRALTKRGRSRLQIEQDFSQMGIHLDVPTLLLSECCLIYLPPEDADAVLSYFTSAFSPATSVGVIVYEPIRPHDAFGRTMVSNLTARGIHLQTLNAHDSLTAQRERMRKHGFGSTVGSGAQGAEAADVDFVWQAWIDGKEKERVENLEWMDEVEEWKLLARHYCVAWGWRETLDLAEGSVFENWGHLPAQDEA